jgi:phthalate 4,5-cis-dihydrodiol dehydrogenase
MSGATTTGSGARAAADLAGVGSAPPIRLGIAGLGLAGALLTRAAAVEPGVTLCAAADPHPLPRAAFARDFGAQVYADIGDLCRDPAVEAVYIGTPHQYHAEHAILAARHGKHIILEKPMALTLAECDAILDAVDRCGVQLIIGHTHAYDPAIRAMRQLIASGDLGRVGMITSLNYTNFLYRPRRPEELDTSRGGGVMYNQVPHQIDMVRLLGGGLVRSVRAACTALDASRPTEGSATAFVEFDNGVAASLVYSGYDFFDSDELHGWVGEGGEPKGMDRHGAARRALAQPGSRAEAIVRAENLAYGARPLKRDLPPHLPHFGTTIVTCERGELRATQDGVMVYDENGAREVRIARPAGSPGYSALFGDLRAALREGRAPLHGGRWGKATVEVALALLQSARERREIWLSHQVAVPEPY